MEVTFKSKQNSLQILAWNPNGLLDHQQELQLFIETKLY